MPVASMLAALLVAALTGLGSPQPVVFNCPQLPPLANPAKSVRELHPQDIKVVMAFGDSVTAGFGMMGAHGNLREDLLEYRGQSWSIGADANASTVFTFLRFYTPKIVGGSLGSHTAELCYDIICPPFQYEPSKDVFNAAQSGAMMPDVVDHEFDYLLAQLEKNPDVDMKNDWKLLTLFIAANDLCLGCSGRFPGLTADEFQRNLNKTLDKVHTQIPRVFVNLILAGNISEIYKLSLKSERCSDIHRIFPIECTCGFLPGEEGDKLRKEMDELAQQYNDRMMEVAAYWNSKKLDDFAVVPQPFLSDTTSDNFTISFLSTLDCFHPSLLAHQNMAKALWNNMITPAAHKKHSFDFTEPFVCPDTSTLLYTY